MDNDSLYAANYVGDFVLGPSCGLILGYGLFPLNDIDQYFTAISSILGDAQRSRQRRLVVISGDPLWARKLVVSFLQQHSFDNALWVAKTGPEGIDVINNKQARQLLGKEIGMLVYDAHFGFDPSAIAAVSGALCGGGLLILITPKLEQWTNRVDPDYQSLLVHPFKLHQLSRRFIHLIRDSLLSAPSSLIIEQNKNSQFSDEFVFVKTETETLYNKNASQLLTHCRTQDQAAVVDAIIKVSTGRRRRPLVITSDRGRGKSSALGIASASLLKTRTRSIVVTAPRLSAVKPVFEHAKNILNVALKRANSLCYQGSSITFVAPDELLTELHDLDLLLVDEAAAIPTAILEQLLRRYSRVVFSTTIHGYEGTGRGFEIRFKKCLDTVTPQWKSLQLSEPIRWQQGDPVEHWLFDALLLNAQKSNDIDPSVFELSQCTVEVLDRDQLLNNRTMLNQLFSLLVNAHYQTSPNDLRSLLDGPNISIWITMYQGKIIAAALVAKEGHFDESLSQAVGRGQRRPHGHLLPQTLAAHGGWQHAPELSYYRVMRIAVAPSLVRLGLGKQLLQEITNQARLDAIDIVGSSFAATADVMAFWRGVQCIPVRIGIKKDTCSGVPSSMVLCALSAPGWQLLTHARERFVQQFCYGLDSIYRELSPALVVMLLSGSTQKVKFTCLTDQDWFDINGFVNDYRQFEDCLLPLYMLVCAALSSTNFYTYITELQRNLLVKVVLQHHNMKEVADLLGLTGKKQLISALRTAMKELVEHFDLLH